MQILKQAILAISVALTTFFSAAAQQVLPQPSAITVGQGSFSFGSSTALQITGLDPDQTSALEGYIVSTQPVLAQPAVQPAGRVVLAIDSSVKGDESYELKVTPAVISVRAAAPAGLFYGWQTVLQLLRDGKVPVCTVSDAPRFQWRGIMIDCSRHFWSKEVIMKQIDAMAMVKLNRLHLHLTDAEGWRIEIKKYPRLTAGGPYYTQSDLREIVAYAAQRHITIVPEVEMPGHSAEVVRVMPKLACDAPGEPSGDLCVGSKETFKFIGNVLKEVMDIFPGQYIHIGGDEATRRDWAACRRCQQVMRREGISTTAGLQSWFTHRIDEMITSKGRKLLGWDEILEGGISPTAIVTSWRGEQGGIQAANDNHGVVMSPEAWCYLNAYQDAPAGEPHAMGRYTPLDSVYAYDPVPQALRGTDAARWVMGLQGNLWTEWVEAPSHLERMIWPRAMAIAEVGWSARKTSYSNFRARAQEQSARLRQLGYTPFDLDAEVGHRTPALVSHQALGKQVTLNTLPHKKYVGADRELTLVNGKQGDWNFFDGQWMGWNDEYLDVTIDMGEETRLHDIVVNFMQEPDAGIFLPEWVAVMASADGKNYSELARRQFAATAAHYAIEPMAWDGDVSARWVRVRAKNARPGNFIFTDEVQLNRDSHDLSQWVNPRVGTGGHGHTFMGANVPFGLVQLGPTQHTRGWDWCSGYHESDSVIIGFGHTHLSGTGVGDLGDIALLPVASAEQDTVLFSHANEQVEPGYYSLSLDNPAVNVELTATKRAGMHRYTFAPGAPALLRLDLKQGVGWDRLMGCGYAQESPQLITGYRRSQGWARDQRVYFAAEFSRPVAIEQGDSGVALLRAPDAGGPLLVRVGISAVSAEGAKANLASEIATWDFDAVRLAARRDWNRELGRALVETSDDNARSIFYTSMYHSMVAPSVWSDVNGDYRGADGKVHNTGGYTSYTTLSLWDTYRAQMPMMTLLFPDMMPDVARTFTAICDEQGKLPVWHLAGNETDCMVGNPGVAVLADLTLKGFAPDAGRALEAMKRSAMLDERGLKFYKQFGYIPYDSINESVARTLEYALADDGIARVAKMLGKRQDYRYFANRAQAYRHYFDPKTQFMRGRDSRGRWNPQFDPFGASHRVSDYTEGNAWQYTWLVPHDVRGLVSLFPSKEAFLTKLDSLFVVTGDLGATASPDITGLIGQYAHGNEPSHHIAWLYNYVGMPWKTASRVREILATQYSNTPDGLCGNEDVGQMSAWYILASLGLYQVQPAGGDWQLGSPIFERATLDVGGGRQLHIVAPGTSAENCYVQSVTFNGEPVTASHIPFASLAQGGTLQFNMGPAPSQWATTAK